MKEQDIITIMNKLKEDPEFNRSFDVSTTLKAVEGRCGGFNASEAETQDTGYEIRDYVEFYVSQFTQTIARPLAMSAAVFVLLIGGFVSASGISFNAVPGDNLYKLKLSIEKTQLALAFSPEQKAKLQVEFTSRRLEEMVDLSASSYINNPTAVKLAVRQFKKEVETIRKDLKQETSVTSQTELAKAVGKKTKEYKATVASSSTNLPDDIKDEVDEVQEILDATQDEAVQVIITAHETTNDEAAGRELKSAFEKQLADLRALKLTAEQNKKLDLAAELQAQGAYRRAFQLLKEVEAN